MKAACEAVHGLLGNLRGSDMTGDDRMTVSATRLTPPPPSPWLLERPTLALRLDGSLTARLTTVVAGAGFGKTTALSTWAAGRRCCWYGLSSEDREVGSLATGLVEALRVRVPALPSDTAAPAGSGRGPKMDPSDIARGRSWGALLSGVLQEHLRRDLTLVVDDLHELDGAEAALALLGELCRQAPGRFHLIVASRRELPFAIERMRGRGQVVELTASDLAFSRPEVVDLLKLSVGSSDVALADSLHRLTGGWPGAVRLAMEFLRGAAESEMAGRFEALRRGKKPLLTFLAEEVLDAEPPEVRDLLSKVARLERFTPELCEWLTVSGAADIVDSLERRGLFLEPSTGELGWYGVMSLVRDLIVARWPLVASEEIALLERASEWFESNGHFVDALSTLVKMGDAERLAKFLSRRGEALLRSGNLQALVRAIDALPEDRRDPGIRQLLGETRHMRGDWGTALTCFLQVAGEQEDLDPRLAWRIGMIYHLKGHLRTALAAYERGRVDGTDLASEALLVAWKAAAHFLLGEAEESRSAAETSLEAAAIAQDDGALAAAHTARALVAVRAGERRISSAHSLHALEAAKRAGDVLQIIRIRTNRGSEFTEEGSYDEALAELASAIQLADLAGYAAYHALALSNRGEVLLHLGRLDEALADLKLARSLYQRIESLNVGYPLRNLGDLYSVRGDLTVARSCYEEAIRLGERADDLQGLVPSLAGLARVLAKDEPETARSHVERAIGFGPGIGYVEALNAGAWVALVGGDRAGAAVLAPRSEAEARRRGNRAGMAEALELRALASDEPSQQLDRLQEAVAAWKDIGHPIGQARAELWVGALVGGAAGRTVAGEATDRLNTLGARGVLAFATRWITPPKADSEFALEIGSLGGFRILRQGEPIATPEWRSKKARDLLKMLVARRGRAVPREVLMEALWPEEDSDKLGNRLSVALTTLRTVFDPERRHGLEHFVTGGKSTVGLDLENVRVDVLDFLAQASSALDLPAGTGSPEVNARLREAEASYTGDFLEEDAYEDWSVPLREEARAAYISLVRALAEAASLDGDHEATSRYSLRLLERDPYDEEAHLLLVRALLDARRHGEARRRYLIYTAQMDEIGVEPVAFPSVGMARTASADGV
ncbi:MAG: tetratricopeptide repeat protein [Actinomycetota bacterium]|nr:tetratricopeptide repeat protein [Actinomycetota bacterium]